MMKRLANRTKRRALKTLPRQAPLGRLARLEPLEDRRMLATFGDGGQTLLIQLATDEQLSIVSNGSSYALTLGAVGTWSGTDSAYVAGNGLQTVTVTSAGQSRYVSGTHIFDDTIATGQSVRLLDSGAN